MRLYLPAILLLATLVGSLPAFAQSDADLEQVLTRMDKAKDSFRTTQATFVWDQFTSVVNDTDTQKGKVYYRRNGNETQMAVDVTDPYPKYVLIADGKLQLFEPKVDRVTVYDLQKNQDTFESFLTLGFGGGGHAMQKNFTVKYLGTEKVAGIDTVKLDLVPKNPKVLNMFAHIVLWVDPARSVAIQQQLFQQGGDYRLAKYSDIQMNQKIADSAFKLKTGGKTTFENVSPHN